MVSLTESGIFRRWINDAIGDDKFDSKAANQNEDVTRLSSLVVSFTFLGFGYVIAFIVLLTQLVYEKWVKAQNESKEERLFVKRDKNPKESCDNVINVQPRNPSR